MPSQPTLFEQHELAQQLAGFDAVFHLPTQEANEHQPIQEESAATGRNSE